MGTQVQTVIFPKSSWNADKAKSWLSGHNMKTGLDTTDDSFRARQKDPGSFDPDSFRTITFGSKSEIARQWLEGHNMKTHQFTIRENAPPGLIPFRARILAAVPGKSLNGRIYTKELLQQTAPLYPSDGVNPRPFILDHDIEHAERVAGMITGATYGVQEAMDGTPVEGLWLEALGYMDDRLFAKMAGSKTIPGFVRGVSIGGEGEGEFTGDGVLIRKFRPAELSVTAFPGIPMAHVAEINRIREHYINHDEVKKTSTIQIKEKDVSLEEAEKQRMNDSRDPRKIHEGLVPGADKGVNDIRPGLPRPTVGSPVTRVTPQDPAANDTGMNVQPEKSTASKVSMDLARGYGSQKGRTGMPTEASAPGPSTAGSPGSSKDAKILKIKTPKTGNTTTQTPGPGKLTPTGTGITDQPEEEEETYSSTANGTKDLDNPHPAKTDTKPSKYPMIGKPNENPHAPGSEEEEEEEHQTIRQDSSDSADSDDSDDSDKGSEEEEEEEEEESREHGPSPHIPGSPKGKVSPHSAANAYDSPADASSEEEESHTTEDDEPVGVTKKLKPGTGDEEGEEDGVTVNPILKTAKQGQHANANPTKEESRNRVLYSEAEPIQARAFSLPTNAGILQTLAAMAGPAKAKEAMAKGSVEELVRSLTRPDHQMKAEEVAKLIENWNRGKMPKEEKPRKIVLGKAAIGSSKDLSIPNARKPPVEESVVRTRSITATTPSFQGSSSSTLSNAHLQELLEQEKRKRFNNVSYLSAAKRAYNRAVQELIQFR